MLWLGVVCLLLTVVASEKGEWSDSEPGHGGRLSFIPELPLKALQQGSNFADECTLVFHVLCSGDSAELMEGKLARQLLWVSVKGRGATQPTKYPAYPAAAQLF
jgi:hypothetical protein